MNKTVKVHGMMSMLAGMQIPPNTADFPENPGLGQVHSSGNSIYVYTEVAGFQTWFPLVRGSDTATYLHTQAVARLTWTVTHNLGTSDVWFIVKDANGDYQSPFSVAPDASDPLNKMIVTFTEAESGTMFLVGSKAFSTVHMNVSELNVANSVSIDSSGISINGVHIDLATLADAGTLSTQITNEINRAVAAEAALATAIDTEKTRASAVESGLTVALHAETARATAAEADNAAAIANETARAEQAEASLQSSITTLTTLVGSGGAGDPAAITAETARAEAAESALQSAITSGDASTLSSAKSYADGLVTGMWNDQGNYDASSGQYPGGTVKKGYIWTISVAGSLGGVQVAVRETVRALVDNPGQTAANWAIGLASTDIEDQVVSGVTGKAPSQNATAAAIAAAVLVESNRAKGAEGSLGALATTAKTSLAAAINEVVANLSAEITRAQAAESNFTTNVSGEASRAQAAEAQLQTNINSEVTARQNAITSLTSTVNSNTSAISAEVTRAQNAETTLQTNISTVASSVTAETARAQAAEAGLQAAINSWSAPVGDTVNPLNGISGNVAIDMSKGTYVTATINGATTLSISNVINNTNAQALTIEMYNGGANVNWPATINWVGGAAPTLKTTGVNVITLITRNGGASWLGMAI